MGPADEIRERAIGAAVTVARAHGLDGLRPRVLQDLSNVLVHLAPRPLVARVATTTAVARVGGARDWLARDVAVAGFAAGAGAAVVPPATEPPPGPHVEDGLALSFWRYVDSDPDRPASLAEAGAALSLLHAELEGYRGGLPRCSGLVDECAALVDRLEASGGLWVGRADDLAERLREALGRARASLADTGRPIRPLHGDATRSNLLRTPGGLVWTDFEDTCAGPVEWDLACLVGTTDDPEATLTAYGYGAGAEALEPFVEARRLQVAVWTAFTAERHPEWRERAEARLSRWT